MAQGPEGASEKPVEPLPDSRSILSDLILNGSQEIGLGGSTRVVATALRNPKSLSKSVAVRAWRLKTAEGQTLYVTKIGRLPKEPGERACSHEQSGNDQKQPHRSVSDNALTATPGPIQEPKDVLYTVFCQQLLSLLKSAGEMKPAEIGDALNLVLSQAKDWLNRAEQDGYVELASKRPIRFRLRPPLL